MGNKKSDLKIEQYGSPIKFYNLVENENEYDFVFMTAEEIEQNLVSSKGNMFEIIEIHEKSREAIRQELEKILCKNETITIYFSNLTFEILYIIAEIIQDYKFKNYNVINDVYKYYLIK